MSLSGRDFLRVPDVSAEELGTVLDLADRLKEERHHLEGTLAGRCAALIFEKQSLRTKAAFAVGAARLGMTSVYFGGDEMQIGRRESPADAARVLSRYFDLVVVRTHAHEKVVEIAAEATCPVVNALSDLEHPCQALADLMTLRRHFGRLEGLRVAWVGDGNNVCHSLILAGALCGLSVAVATPEGFGPDEAVLDEARLLGGEVAVLREPAEAVAGVHAVYTDTWVSMGQEDESSARREAFRRYGVDAGLMEVAGPEAVFLHCLPAHRGEEVTAGVLDGPGSLVLEQAENRLHVQAALMALLLA